MRRTLIVFIMLFFSINFLSAQSQSEILWKQDSLGLFSHKYGLFFNYNLNFDSSDFKTLSNPKIGTEGTLAKFDQGGSGTGFSFGGFYEYPFTKKISLFTKLGF